MSLQSRTNPFLLSTACLVAGTVSALSASDGKDKGYLFAGPHVPTRTNTLKNGLTLLATHQPGVIVSETRGSPWPHATFFAQGTLVQDTQGKVLKEVTKPPS